LFDLKGARKQPRVHALPLTKRAAKILARYIDGSVDGKRLPCLFTTNGRVSLRIETLSAIVNDVCRVMMVKGTAREAFQLRDVRRTCETMLAQMGVSKDIRAQLLSHGLGGVQDRHYDRHDYMEEKRRALKAWEARLLTIYSGRVPTKVAMQHYRDSAVRQR
jgi:integrase